MQPAGHRIEIIPERKLMTVTLWGAWANAQSDGLIVDHAKAVRDMKAAGVPHGQFLTLVDMRQKILTAEVAIVEFRRSFEANSPSRRTVIIVSSSLPISMGVRIAPPERLLVTHSEEDAMSWLFA